MKDIVVALFLVAGSGFILIASLGLSRMPDVFTRMSCAAKATTLGFGLLLAGLAIHFMEIGVSSRALATIGFIILTTPVASHRIGRAAYLGGSRLWKGTVLDDWGASGSSGASPREAESGG